MTHRSPPGLAAPVCLATASLLSVLLPACLTPSPRAGGGRPTSDADPISLLDGGGRDAGAPDADPWGSDAGPSADTGPAPTDGGPDATPDAPPADSGPSPDEGLAFLTWPEQHDRSGGRWGSALTDIVRHLPESYGDYYYDEDPITYGHETTHGIHSHIRNYLNDTGERANGFYVLENRAIVIAEPDLWKSDVAPYVPPSLRGSRYDTYVTGSPDWDDTPLYLWDEWVAYTNGGAVGTELVRLGYWDRGWRDGVAGQLEFTVYAIAVAMAVEELDPGYLATHDSFLTFLAWNARRAMSLYREGAAMDEFAWSTQDEYYEGLRANGDAEDLRAWVRRTFGAGFAAEVFEF